MHGQIEQQKQRKAEGESQGSNTDKRQSNAMI